MSRPLPSTGGTPGRQTHFQRKLANNASAKYGNPRTVRGCFAFLSSLDVRARIARERVPTGSRPFARARRIGRDPVGTRSRAIRARTSKEDRKAKHPRTVRGFPYFADALFANFR